MAAADTDRNLLLGILAYQNAFVSKEQLLAAMQAWLHDKAKPLTEILRAFGALDDQKQTLLEALVTQHLKQHAGDPQASLHSLPASATIHAELQVLDDPELQVSLTHMSAIKSVDMLATVRSPALGAPSGSRFLVLRPHAKGGLGEVWVAEDTELNREVALKEIREELAGDEVSRVRFMMEAQITGGLEHPGIVPVYGLDKYPDGRPFYVMRLIRGVSLQDCIKRFHAEGAVTVDRTLELHSLVRRLVDVCNALQYAHDRGVFHRDIKPANIMLGKYGETLIVDWGLAKATGASHIDADTPPSHDLEPPLKPVSGGSSIETVAGAAVGTPAYMSPEQAEGRIDLLGPACDTYSVGATLYSILTGDPPAQGAIVEVLEKVRTGNIERPRHLNPKIDPALEAICLKAMALRPSSRYASPRVMADDLEHWLAGEPVIAYPEPKSLRVRRWMAKHRTPVTAFGSLLIAMIPLLVFFLWLTEDARETLQSAQGETKKALEKAVKNEKQAEANRDEATKLAAHNKTLAVDNEKGRREAEALLIKLRFEQAFQRPMSERAVSILEMARLLGDPTLQPHPALEDSLRLHLGSMIQEVPTLKHLLAHGDEKVTAAFSPDGTRVLTGGADRTARLWDTASGNLLIPPMSHDDAIVAVAFSPDGKTMLTANGNHAQVWDATTGKAIGARMTHENAVEAITFSLDSTMVLTGSRDDTARLWDAGTGKLLHTLKHEQRVVAVAFSSDGKTALTGSWDQTARLWNTSNGKAIGQPIQHDAIVLAVAFHPTESTFATTSYDTVRRWAMDGKPIGPILQHAYAVKTLAYNSAGDRLLTGGGADIEGKGEARLWNLGSGKMIGQPLPHKNIVHAVAFSPDGHLAMTGCGDATAHLWDAATAQAIGPPLRHHGAVRSLAFRRDGTMALTASAGAARLWELAVRPIVLLHDHAVKAALYDPDGKRILTASGDAAQLWDSATGKPFGASFNHSKPILAAALSAVGDLALTGDSDGNARLWRIDSRREIEPSLRHDKEVWSLAFSPDGARALVGAHEHASGTSARAAFLWQLAARKRLKLELPVGSVQVVGFSPDGTRVLAGLDDGRARLLDATTGAQIGADLEHPGQVVCIAFSPDSTILLTGSKDGDNRAHLWEAGTGKRVASVQHHDGILAVAFSSDGRTILTGSLDKTAQLWHADGKPRGAPLQHQSDVNVVAFSHDGKLALTGSRDKTARLWEAATGKPLGAPLRHDAAVTSVSFHPTGVSALTASHDGGTAKLWRVPNPIRGDADRVLQYVEMITGLKHDERGNVVLLDRAEWRERRQHLQHTYGAIEPH